MPRTPHPDLELLQAALLGLEHQRAQIDAQMEALWKRIAAVSARPAGKRLSAAARRRIAAAQKARWAAYRKRAEAAKPRNVAELKAMTVRKAAAISHR